MLFRIFHCRDITAWKSGKTSYYTATTFCLPLRRVKIVGYLIIPPPDLAFSFSPPRSSFTSLSLFLSLSLSISLTANLRTDRNRQTSLLHVFAYKVNVDLLHSERSQAPTKGRRENETLVGEFRSFFNSSASRTKYAKKIYRGSIM